MKLNYTDTDADADADADDFIGSITTRNEAKSLFRL